MKKYVNKYTLILLLLLIILLNWVKVLGFLIIVFSFLLILVPVGFVGLKIIKYFYSEFLSREAISEFRRNNRESKRRHQATIERKRIEEKKKQVAFEQEKALQRKAEKEKQQQENKELFHKNQTWLD